MKIFSKLLLASRNYDYIAAFINFKPRPIPPAPHPYLLTYGWLPPGGPTLYPCISDIFPNFLVKVKLDNLFIFVFYRLPNEIFFDAFKFLNRRQLTNSERVCLRFHRIINDHIGEAPFLRLDFGVGLNARFCFFL